MIHLGPEERPLGQENSTSSISPKSLSSGFISQPNFWSMAPDGKDGGRGWGADIGLEVIKTPRARALCHAYLLGQVLSAPSDRMDQRASDEPSVPQP